MMWVILSGTFIATAALMVTTWDEVNPVEPHPWLVEPPTMRARTVRKKRRLDARFRH